MERARGVKRRLARTAGEEYAAKRTYLSQEKWRRKLILNWPIGLLFLAGAQSLPADGKGGAATAPAAEIVIRDFLVIEAVGKAGRSPIHTDAIEARIVAGERIEAREGDSVPMPDGSSKTWQVAKAGMDGTLEHAALRGGYAFARVDVDTDDVWLLEAAGHNLVYVNGELRTGDPYSLGFVQLPMALKRGTNHFLFQGARGKLRARRVRPKGPMVLDRK